MEGLREANADLTVFVHPCRSADVSYAVRRQLSSLLFTSGVGLGTSSFLSQSKNRNLSREICMKGLRYNELFDGVLLSHEFIIQDRKAKILPGLIPFFGVKVKAKLLLFSPKPDMILEGKVVKIGRDSIHAVVLGFASAAILMEDIRDEFKFKKISGVDAFAFVSRLDRKHAIKVGSMIRFSVKSVDEELIHVTGSLLQPNTGCLRRLCKHWSDDASHNRSKKRHRDAKSKELDASGDESQPHKLRRTNSDG